MNKRDALIIISSSLMFGSVILLFFLGFISLGTSLEHDRHWGIAGSFFAIIGGVCGLLAGILISEQKDYPYAIFGVIMAIVGAFFLGETFTGIIEIHTFFIFGFPIMILLFISLIITIKRKERFS
jgi:hypothetical protein